MSTINKKKINAWKWGFISLVTIIVIALASVWLYLSGVSSEPYEPVQEEQGTSEEQIEAKARLSIMSFNSLMQSILGNDVPYQLAINDEVNFSGTFETLGLTIPYTIQGDPQVLADGNIGINITTVQLSGLDLPVQTVLSLFQIAIPDHIPLEVLSDQKQLVVRLDKVSADTEVSMRAQTIDLENDNIEILFDIPLTYLQEQIMASQEQ